MKIKLFVNSFRKGKKMKRFKFTLKNRDCHPYFYGESAEDIIRSILYDEEIISYEEIPFLTSEENEIINHIKKEMEFKGCIRRSDTSFYLKLAEYRHLNIYNIGGG